MALGYRQAQVDWVRILVRAAMALDDAPFGLAVVDPASGRICHHNLAMAALLQRPVPPTVGDLDRLGVVAAGTREELVSVARSLDREDSCTTIRARIVRPTGPTVEAEVFVSHLHAVHGEGSAVVVVASDRDDAFDNRSTDLAPVPVGTFHLAYDEDLVVVAADRHLGEVGVDPGSLVGSHPFVMGHPVDVLRVGPLARALAVGAVTEAGFVTRLATPGGRWINVACDLRRLAGAEGPVVLAAITPRDRHLESVPPGCLTDRELEVARALFSGRRPAQIAAENGVSHHTVRNQMRSVLTKLGVGGQAELLTRYLRPPRPASTRIRQAVSPRDRIGGGPPSTRDSPPS